MSNSLRETANYIRYYHSIDLLDAVPKIKWLPILHFSQILVKRGVIKKIMVILNILDHLSLSLQGSTIVCTRFILISLV